MQKLPLKACLQQSGLEAYISGEIHNEPKLELEEHLCRCDDCFEKLITILNPRLNEAEPLISGSAGGAKFKIEK